MKQILISTVAALSLPLPVSFLLIGNVLAAENDCQSFRIQGSSILIEDNNSTLKSGSLASIATGVSAGQIVVIDFPKSEICVQGQSDAALSGGALVVNSHLDELAINASIDGSYDVLLRIDLNFESELLIERGVGEDIGLTEMEFLSDNSGVGAEDFFAEEIGFLEVGGAQLGGLFAEVPRYGISYNHYQGLDDSGLADTSTTRGSLGLAVLRDVVLTINYQDKGFAINKP